jgi:hypothetical protein
VTLEERGKKGGERGGSQYEVEGAELLLAILTLQAEPVVTGL